MPEAYRFRGQTPPKPGTRASVLNYAPAADAAEGVATLRLFDPIDSWGEDWGVSAKEFSAALNELPGATREIRLHLNSPGGEVFEAITILNMLRQHPARVVAVVDGLAASAASFLAVGADELVMGQNATLMIHDAWGGCIGNAADMRDLAGQLDMLSDNIASIYAKKSGGSIEDWRGAMLAESWYTAEEAVAAGLADSVDGEVKGEPIQNNFDMSAFQYPGRDKAPEPVLAQQEDAPDWAGITAAKKLSHALKSRTPQGRKV